LEAAQTVDTAQRRIETGAKAGFGRFAVTRNDLAEAAGIRDLVDHEGVDLVELAARDLDADIVEIEAQRLVLDVLDAVGVHEAEGQLEVEARLGLDVLDLAEAQDDRLLAFVDHEHRRIGDEEKNAGGDQDS